MAKRLFNILVTAGIAAGALSLEQQVANSFDPRANNGPIAYAAAQENVQQASAYEITLINGYADAQKIFFGTISPEKKTYQVFGFIDYAAIIRETPEYAEALKAEPGTAKHWIKLSEASDKAVRAISKYATENGLEFVADQGYIGSLEIKLNGSPVLDPSLLVITQQVKDYMNALEAAAKKQ